MAISSPAHRSRSVAPEGPSLFAGILRVRHFFSQYLTALSAFATERHTLRVVSVKSFPTEKRRLRPGWPVNGAISSGFGYRKHPFTRRRSFHNGIDIKAKTGTLVCAPAGGTVIYRNRLGANGNLVKIRCADGIILHFAHLKTYSCRLGQRIAPGQAIGTVGSTGRATGPHLHFVVQRQGRYINPLQYLGRK
jgi:murein DD-endopeptidase MepM/ murein hydrolase activator NlpD